MRIVLDWQVDDVAVAGAVDDDDAVEEAGVLRMDCGWMLRLAGRQHGRVVGRVVRRVSGCSGIDMTDCLRTSRRVGLRSKGRREDECGEQNAGQMAMAAHW